MNLMGRTLLILSGVAAISTLLALAVQDRALSGDLREAALGRLERAALSTERLAANHVEALRERYRAISGTPQFRANLEVGDVPTLEFYARQLAAREGAALIAFLDHAGELTAAAGDILMIPTTLALAEPGLLAHEARPFAVVSVPLQTADRLIGQLVAAEPISNELVQQWSDLCGAEVSFSLASGSASEDLVHVVEALESLELSVSVSMEPERSALIHSRFNLLTAGGVALAFAFAVSVLVSRGLVRPILDIQNATERIGAGDLSVRLTTRRSDELGDVARAFDSMRGSLADYRSQVEDQHRALEDNVDRLRRSQAELANAQRLAHIGSWSLDMAAGELWGSEEFRAIFGLPTDDKPIAPNAVLSRVHARDRADVENAVYACVTEGTILRLDCRVSLEGSPERVLHIQAQVQRSPEGDADRLEGTVQDVTERKRSEEQIRYLAYRDNLTGLGNRLLCRERLEIQLTQARRNESLLGVLFLDLDRFKRINDTLGHSLGDELLKGVADRLVASIRTTDYVSREELNSSISRLGGDEFTLVVSQPRDVQDFARVARRLLDALARPFTLGGHEVVISGSIGITVFPFDGEDVESLLRNADAAMYHAKEQGRNNYQYYADSMNEVAMRRLILESKMRSALESGEFELHYQPKVSLETGAVTSSEALVRWRDPSVGLIGPGDFIPVAEESGFIEPLGDWVLRTACAQIRAWSEAGLRVPVSVNLSAHQFRTGRLAERILAIVSESGIEPQLLELEITESTLMHDERAVVADLEVVKASGVGISVDDFGTGYSSFAYLRQLPVDALKIDRFFVSEIASNPADAALTASIVSMGKALGLRVIAEGVETEAQRDLLAQWGCDEMQGFLFSPGVPAEELETRFELPSRAG